jgi:hypothetical protein
MAAATKKKQVNKLVLTGMPNLKQAAFFEATTRYVGYGGSRGGG